MSPVTTEVRVGSAFEVLPTLPAGFVLTEPPALTDEIRELLDTRPGWFVFHVRRGEGPLHPCQAPVEPLVALLNALVPQGGLVIDPFCGSGSVLVAARETGRPAIGVEIDPHVANAARWRLGRAH